MKKTLLAILTLCCSLTIAAQETKIYTDDLVVSVDEETAPAQKTDIEVTFSEDKTTCTLALKNFCLINGEDITPVGNIIVDNIALKNEEAGYKTFNVSRVINISAGDIPGTTELDWIGTFLGDVPIEMTGKVTDDRLYCIIDINMESLNQIIKVTFGNDITTSVSAVTTNQNGKVNVYTINGVCVAKNVDAIHALDGLKSGLYIVNGQKVIKK